MAADHLHDTPRAVLRGTWLALSPGEGNLSLDASAAEMRVGEARLLSELWARRNKKMQPNARLQFRSEALGSLTRGWAGLV